MAGYKSCSAGFCCRQTAAHCISVCFVRQPSHPELSLAVFYFEVTMQSFYKQVYRLINHVIKSNARWTEHWSLYCSRNHGKARVLAIVWTSTQSLTGTCASPGGCSARCEAWNWQESQDLQPTDPTAAHPWRHMTVSQCLIYDEAGSDDQIWMLGVLSPSQHLIVFIILLWQVEQFSVLAKGTNHHRSLLVPRASGSICKSVWCKLCQITSAWESESRCDDKRWSLQLFATFLRRMFP